MKNLSNSIKKIQIILLSFVFCLEVYSQTVCDISNPTIPFTSSTIQSSNGYDLPASGTIRILFILCEVNYTGTISDPQPASGSAGWPAHQLPSWINNSNPDLNLFDFNPPTLLTPHGQLTKYYFQASSGNLTVLGDFLLAPTNNGVFSIPCTNSYVDVPDVVSTVNNSLSSLITSQGFVLGDFDKWIKTSMGEAKISSVIPFTNYDNVIFLWRNSYISDNTGNTDPNTSSWNLFGHNADSRISIGCSNSIPTNVVRHEFAHLILGSNNFHNGEGTQENYWIPKTNAPGLLNLWDPTTNCWTAWDRQRLGWKAAGVTHEIAARNQSNTAEMNGDLDASNPSDAGIYTLRDFVTTGDAIRIKLPYFNLSTEYPEYIWLENHNGKTFNNSIFDEWAFAGSCVDPLDNGLYLFTQIDKDIRTGPLSFGGSANYYRPITAEGCYDRYLLSSSVTNNCLAGVQIRPFVRPVGLQNPLTGTGDNDQIDNDVINPLLHSLVFNDIYPNDYEYIPSSGSTLFNLPQNGGNRQLFRFTGNNNLGISTNPCSASRMNLVHQDFPSPGSKNLRKIYLNGISIKIINQFTSGEIQVEIKFDQTDIENDVRWCGDKIILSPIPSANGYSLNIKTGKTILLDRSLSPTRITLPESINGTDVYSDPTVFDALNSSIINLEANSFFTLENNSTLLMESGSKIIIRNGSVLRIKSGSKLDLRGGSILEVENGGRVIIDDDGSLDYYANAIINLNGSNSILEIGGTLNIQDGANFTFTSSSSQHGYLLFANSTLFPSANITAGNTCSITLTGTSQNSKILQINQETFHAPSNLINFTINNGKVAFNSGSRLQADGMNTIINFNNAKFTSTTPGSNNGHRGVHLYGQPNILINNCIFEYGQYGIFAFLTYGGNSLNIFNSIFRNNHIGINAYDKGINLYNCYFLGNENGSIGSLMSYNSRFLGATFNGNTFGLNWHSHSTASLTLDNPYINFNGTGTYVQEAQLIVKCGTVSFNNIGFAINYGATLMMNDLIAAPDPAADVTAVGNDYTIKTHFANYLNLNKGLNDLTPSGINSQSSINGTMLSGGQFPLIANFNKWNSAGTFSTNDYNLNDPNGNSLTIIDVQPQSSATACGQAIPPCPNPPCNYPDALNYCPLCEVINSDDFVNTKLNEATLISLDMVHSTIDSNYRRAINLFCQILNENIPNPDGNESYLLNLNYLKLLETLGHAFESNQISCGENDPALCPEVQMSIEVENNFINKAISDGNYYRQFLYSMDKAQIYRLACRRDDCLDVLNEMLNWVNQNDREEVNNFICSVQLEKSILNGTDIGQADELLQQCSGNNNFRISAPIKAILPSVIDQEITVSVFPNPIRDIASIRTNIENARIILFDGLGRIINDEKINYDSDIDFSLLPQGIYTLKIENLNSSEYRFKKLIIQ